MKKAQCAIALEQCLIFPSKPGYGQVSPVRNCEKNQLGTIYLENVGPFLHFFFSKMKCSFSEKKNSSQNWYNHVSVANFLSESQKFFIMFLFDKDCWKNPRKWIMLTMPRQCYHVFACILTNLPKFKELGDFFPNKVPQRVSLCT